MLGFSWAACRETLPARWQTSPRTRAARPAHACERGGPRGAWDGARGDRPRGARALFLDGWFASTGEDAARERRGTKPWGAGGRADASAGGDGERWRDGELG